MRSAFIIAAMTVVLATAGCVAGYTLVAPQATQVAGGTMSVQPTAAWNRSPKGPYDVEREENWTRNGPLLETITFIGGIAPGEAVRKQRPKDERKVPAFRPEMTPQDLVSMIESFYRIEVGATIFESESVKPATLLGGSGIQFDYRYVAADEVKRRGRTMIAIVNQKLYVLSLSGAALHYFDASLPEFEAIVASATIT